MSINNTPAPPYPRLGELYRALAVALGTKGKNADVDRMAREGEFNWALLSELRNELITAPLAKYIDAEFARVVDKSVAHFHDSYIGLVSHVPLDSLSRGESLPLLIEHFFTPYATDLVFGVHQTFGGPDLMQLFDPDLHPVAVVLAWLGSGEQVPLVKLAYPTTTDSDRNNAEKYRKWARGSDLPDIQSIDRFADALGTSRVVGEEKRQNLRRWLLIARAIAHLERESPIPFRAVMRRHLLLGIPNIDIGRILSAAVCEIGERFSTLTMPALMLYEQLKRTTKKEVGEQEKLRTELDRFEDLQSQAEPEGRTRFHAEWMRGRWHVLAGQFDDALPHYARATDLASYRAGGQHKTIVEETLALAGHLGDKVLIKRLKHWATAFGIFNTPIGDDIVQDWEIDQFSQQFHHLFPAHGRFPEALALGTDGEHLPFLVFDGGMIARLKPDRRAPDRVVSIRCRDGQIRRWAQLRLFASFNNVEAVQTLLDAGASVDELDESGGSALLCAIQQAEQTDDRRVLQLLLTHLHSSAVLNSVTAKKRLTPLLCAIELGDPTVVERLLKMGAAVDLKGQVAERTPLYFALETLGALKFPAKLHEVLIRSPETSPDLVKKELLRRHNIAMAGVFGEGRPLSRLLKTPRNRKLFKVLAATIVTKHGQRHTVPNLLRIIELLLEHGANPNAPHRYPEPGRTPLMLAAESDTIQAFDLMLRHHGNPFQQDEAGMNCVKIAMAFGSGEVASLMRRKGIL